MPASNVTFMPRDHLLSFEEITQAVAWLSQLGIRKVRLTGGEPLMRRELPRLVAMLRSIRNDDNAELPAIDDLAMTTNGILLPNVAGELLDAGLRRVNISLDTLDSEIFQRIARRDDLSKVLAGIDSALSHGFEVRLNALVLRNVNLTSAVDLVRFAVERGITMRFIEFMPLDSDRNWSKSEMVAGDELRQRIASELGELSLLPSSENGQTAREYSIASGGRVGFIDSVSAPFCQSCNRLRLAADGKLRNCLFGESQWDLKESLRDGDQNRFNEQVMDCVSRKFASHGIDQASFQPPSKAMYQIGG